MNSFLNREQNLVANILKNRKSEINSLKESCTEVSKEELESNISQVDLCISAKGVLSKEKDDH